MSKHYGPIHIINPFDWEKKGNTKGLTFVDGIPHRMRRGKLVPIPKKWFGHKVDDQTRRKRNEIKDRTAKLKKKRG